MAKKRVNKKEDIIGPVINCDQSNELVAICDQLVKVDADGSQLDSSEVVLSQYDIEKLILTIRGKQVLIDRDLGKIYGVETKRLNEQVRRNIARFPDRYRFQLSKDEMQELSAQIKATDNEIDNLVFDLYGLTEEERKIVMDTTNIK